ncbi:hypothetical protein J5TS2_41040 [Brevibacillus halotolerans]|uniref:hypothetical protein n=1 Tax=Brevibacillus halotolerans TaxID=1507437 RepID=UPI001B2F07C5|nr:hypothetical protein [Brevibacillus halotolerans]GIO03436.1 hypothetical protein J5TS2_41040 [Brevibacillus halotolerans]
MDNLIAVVSSLIEFFAIFALIFGLFRINIIEYLPETIFSGSLMTFISYWIRDVNNIELAAPFIQIGLLIIIMWVIFRYHLFWSAFISVTGYVTYGIIQAIFVLLFNSIFMVDITNHDTLKYVLQISTGCFSFILFWGFYHFNVGFNFVPHGRSVSIKLSKTSYYIIASVVGLLFTFSASYCFFEMNKAFKDDAFYMLVLSTICLIAFYWLSKKKE